MVDNASGWLGLECAPVVGPRTPDARHFRAIQDLDLVVFKP
jgi:hypothetical protein